MDVAVVKVLSLTFDEFPDAPVRRAAIHDVRAAPVSPRTILDLMERLDVLDGFEGFRWEHDLKWLTAGDAWTTISVHELSGGLRYRLRPLADEPGTDVTASPSRLEEIARGFLQRLGRPTEHAQLERITYLRAQQARTDGSALAPVTLDAGLIFTRTIDELPVVGPGGVAMVKIGTDETVVGGREVWRPLVRRGSSLTLRTADEAIDLLRSKLKRLGLDGEARVRKARLGYAEAGVEVAQRHLEPCYAFLIETVGGLVDFKRVELIPATRSGPMASAFTG